MALVLTMYCARTCSVFEKFESMDLNQEETDCLRVCASNIALSFPRFYDDVRSTMTDMS